MIVYNLACENEHHFEGWFHSPADFENQRDRGLVECPFCGSRQIERRLHAPRINTGVEPPAAASATRSPEETSPHLSLARLAHLAAEIRANTENVGERFAEEARAMHYGEKPRRGIRGKADTATANELREEGIEVYPLPFPVDWPGLN
jgi:Uncharacterized protein conserved in bacteria